MISKWTTLGQRLRTTNDANGNRRALYVLYDSNGTVAWIERDRNEHLTHPDAVAAWKRCVELPTIRITVAEFGSWLELLIERGYHNA